MVSMKYRKHIQEHYGFTAPDEDVLWDTDDAFGFKTSNGTVCAFNKSEHIWWRSKEVWNEHHPDEVI